MTFEALLAFAGAFLCSSLGIGVVYREPRALETRAFALGMLVLALRELFVGLGAQATLPLESLGWQRLAWMTTTMLPGSWLLFSMSYSRTDRRLVSRWKWGIVGALAFPLVGVALFSHTTLGTVQKPYFVMLQPGWTGYVLGVFDLLIAVIVLANLEGSLRAATGIKRWEIKFCILGVIGILAVYVYTMSQTLLFTAVPRTAQSFDSWGALIGGLLILTSLTRQRLGSTRIYLSQTTIYNSLTVLLVGIYLLAVGVLAKAVSAFGDNRMLPLGAFFVFVALVALTILLLSDQVRHHIKRLISLHVYRARHDYRQRWMTFNRRTASIVDVNALCASIVGMVSETFATPSVTIWLWHDEKRNALKLGGSTVFSGTQLSPPGFTPQDIADLMDYLQTQPMPIDFAMPPDARGKELARRHAEALRRARIRHAIALMAGQTCLGILSLDERLTHDPFTVEDQNLLKVMTDQTATSLLSLQLTQRLSQARQMEAFQTLSAFFVHDLKNLASKLSMTLQTLPIHYDKPAFREDMLHLVADSVGKINTMCDRLSLLGHRLELSCTETDLTALVRDTLAGLRPSLSVPLITDLRPLPRLTVDPERLENVLVNLVMNAHEAVEGHGEIRVITERLNGWAVLSVHDTGYGMSPTFIERSLFQPFHTTKSRGLGIGLFQCKMIVEAHRGSIEVESEEGKGSTFRVLLPC